MTLRSLLTAAALSLLPLGASAPLIAATVAVAPDLAAKLKAAATRAVPAGNVTVHPVLALDLGGGAAAAIALYSEDKDSGSFAGVTAVAGPDGVVHTAALPPVETGARMAEARPEAVFTVDDTGGRKALVMLWWYYVDGTGDPEWHGGYVYRWDGHAWSVDERRSRRLDNVKTAKAARAKLAG